MEKLSERIDTLKPRNSQKFNADLVDFLIYAVTLIPIINIITPLYNTEEYNWFRAVIMGSLIFVVVNYFLRYYIPMKLKGRTIGKYLFNLQTVDYYGYEVKPGQLMLKESFYIFLPVLLFSKFTMFNYVLLLVWLLFYFKSVFNVYYLTNKSIKQKVKEAKELVLKDIEEQELELEQEELEKRFEAVGYYVFDKRNERKKKYKLELKEIKKNESEQIKSLQEKHKSYLSTLQDKDAIYQAKIKQKLELEKLQEHLQQERKTFDHTYDQDILQITHQELEKAEEIIEQNKDEEPNYYPISEFVVVFPHFLHELHEIDASIVIEDEVLEDGTVVKKTPFDPLIEKYQIDELPKRLIRIKQSNPLDIKLQRTIESGNTFIVDIECRYEKISYKKDNETKEKIEVVTPIFKTSSFKLLMFQENEKPIIHFNEPKLYGKAKKRAKLHQKAINVQSRSIMDLQANTVTVDYTKFQEFFETHRTEE